MQCPIEMEVEVDDATHFALQQIVAALHRSGAIGPRNVQEIVSHLRGQQGTFGGDEDASIAAALERLADAIDKDAGD
jgi:hypothetical protein